MRTWKTKWLNVARIWFRSEKRRKKKTQIESDNRMITVVSQGSHSGKDPVVDLATLVCVCVCGSEDEVPGNDALHVVVGREV